MKMRTVELTVGAFMLVGILSLLMLAVQVSGLGHLVQEDKGYTVQAEFSNIGGLKVRAKVSIAGVVVGRVVSVVLEPTTYNAKVEFTVNPNKIDKIPGDTRASIMTSGLLGDNYIALTPGFDDANPLKEGSIIPASSTNSAIVLEELVSKFVAGQASKGSDPKKEDKKKSQIMKVLEEKNNNDNGSSAKELIVDPEIKQETSSADNSPSIPDHETQLIESAGDAHEPS